MAMTQDEKTQFKELKNKVNAMGIELIELTGKIDKILSIVKGIAIGIGIGGLLFGFISLKDLLSTVK